MTYLDYNSPIIPGGSFDWHEYALLRAYKEPVFAIPTETQINNARFLFTELQKLRVELGKPMYIKSGARTDTYTQYLRSKGIPAALGSAHNEWKAVDISVPNMKTIDLWKFCHDRWPGRMENFSHTPTWCHLDTKQFGQRIRFNP